MWFVFCSGVVYRVCGWCCGRFCWMRVGVCCFFLRWW